MLPYPLQWKCKHNVFACPEGDLFHKAVPKDFIYAVFAVMESTWWNNYIFTTKRAERMGRILSSKEFLIAVPEVGRKFLGERFVNRKSDWGRNVWVGVSVENQEKMDLRAQVLPSLPKNFHKMIFACPQLDSLVIPKFVEPHIEWVINSREVKGGKDKDCKPRVVDRAFQKALQDQCLASSIPYFLADKFTQNMRKEMGIGRLQQWPKELKY